MGETANVFLSITEMELAEANRPELLDPLVWEEGLSRFARATNLAVLLTDTEGCAVGDCLNPQPTWSMLRKNKPISRGECPFCIEVSKTMHNCVADAVETREMVTTCDTSGLVHLVIPLLLSGRCLGALVVGQVFDRYPNHLQLHNLARKMNVAPEKLWQSARLECPKRREELQVYGRLLETFSSALVQARFQRIADQQRLTEISRLNDLSNHLALEQRKLAVGRKQQIESTAKVLEQTRQELRAVTGRLVSAQEEERERMARELHDSIGTGIVLFQFDIHALHQMIPNELRRPVEAQFEAISRRIREIADEVRLLSHQLHPSIVTDLGLEEAVRQLGQNLRKHYPLRVRVSARNVSAGIDSTVSLGLYRIIQEALQNVVRHAGSASVTITLSGGPSSIEVSITDTGKGFELSETTRGLGLINMAQRAEFLGGTLKLESQPSQGTKVYVRVPLRPTQSE